MGRQGNVLIVTLWEFEHVFIYFINLLVVDNSSRLIVEKFGRGIICFKKGNCGKIVNLFKRVGIALFTANKCVFVENFFAQF